MPSIYGSEISGQVPDAAKLGGQLASYYASDAQAMLEKIQAVKAKYPKPVPQAAPAEET